ICSRLRSQNVVAVGDAGGFFWNWILFWFRHQRQRTLSYSRPSPRSWLHLQRRAYSKLDCSHGDRLCRTKSRLGLGVLSLRRIFLPRHVDGHAVAGNERKSFRVAVFNSEGNSMRASFVFPLCPLW